MRIAALILFSTLSVGQTLTPEDTILKAQELYTAGKLAEAAQELTNLIRSPEAVNYTDVQSATAYSNLATVYQDTGRIMDAERAYQRARDLLADQVSDPVCLVLWFRTSNNLASMYMETEQIGKAQRLVDTLLKTEIPYGEDVVRFRGTQASLLMVRGRDRDAEELFKELLEYWQRTRNAKESAVLLNNLGVLAIRRGDWGSAARYLSQSVDLWKQAVGEEHPAVLTSLANYGYVLLMGGRKQQAAEVLESAFTTARRLQGQSTPVIAQLALLYSQALEVTGRREEAKSLKAEARRMSSALTATDPARHTVDILDLSRK